MERANNLYTHVVDITTVYLGPIAERFVARQIRNHLQKDPEALHKEDLKELIAWLQIAMAFLTSDDTLIQQYVGDLKSLAGRKAN